MEEPNQLTPDQMEEDELMEAIALGKIEGCSAFRALAQVVKKETEE